MEYLMVACVVVNALAALGMMYPVSNWQRALHTCGVVAGLVGIMV